MNEQIFTLAVVVIGVIGLFLVDSRHPKTVRRDRPER